MDTLQLFIEFLLTKNVDVQNETLDLEHSNNKLEKLEAGTWWTWLASEHKDAMRLLDLNRMQNITHDIYKIMREFKGVMDNDKRDD